MQDIGLFQFSFISGGFLLIVKSFTKHKLRLLFLIFNASNQIFLQCLSLHGIIVSCVKVSRMTFWEIVQ